MLSTRRRPLVVGLSLVFLLVLAACGDDGDDAEVVGEADRTTTESTTTEAEDGATTESTLPETSGEEGTGGIDDEAPGVTWLLGATGFRGRDGDRVAYACPPNDQGVTPSVWGTDIYTDDSSVCMAAVHAGLITQADGGRVVIEIAPGRRQYTGSEANGVTSLDYGLWNGSFTFPQA